MRILIDFPTELKKIRLDKGHSQEYLSNLAGLHRTHISLLECGKRKPSLVTTQKIAFALDMHTWEFVKALEILVSPV